MSVRISFFNIQLSANARAARFQLLQIHVDLGIAVSAREFEYLMTSNITVIQSFAPYAPMPLLHASLNRFCSSMDVAERGLRQHLPEHSVRVDIFVHNGTMRWDAWTANDGPTEEQEKEISKVSVCESQVMHAMIYMHS